MWCSPKGIVLNEVPFEKVAGCNYRFDYLRMIHDAQNAGKEREIYRSLLQQDLWFLVYFVMRVDIANHPFWVQACRDVDEGPRTGTIDLWARGHGKTTIISVAETIKDLLCNQEERICIFSYAKTPAESILRSIKTVFEESDFLRWCFPEILHTKKSDAPKWSEGSGLVLKRKGSYREPSVYASGLVEGMPTGAHFTKCVYDDIETFDVARSVELIARVKAAYDLSLNLISRKGRRRVVGTYYHHDGPLVYVGSKRGFVGKGKAKREEFLYTVRKKPATVDGQFNGEPVFLSHEELEELKCDLATFSSQQLLDPTYREEMKLDWSDVKFVSSEDIPKRLMKIMVVDGANGGEDAWAIHCVGVEPFVDDMGASNLYLLDSVVKAMSHEDGVREIVDMYCRNGRILTLGVEKTGLSTLEVHVAAALKARGKKISEARGTLTLLRPKQSKQDRMLSMLSWPLHNGKIHFSSELPDEVIERLKTEMGRFPLWHDDGWDALSWAVYLTKEFNFPLAGYRGGDFDDEHRRSREVLTGREWMTV